MIEQKNGRLVIKGLHSYLRQIWEFHGKYEVLNDMMNGMIKAKDWDDETENSKKIEDFLDPRTVVLSHDAEIYLNMKKYQKQHSINKRIEALEGQISGLSEILNKILENHRTILKEITNQNKFYTLKDIAERYKLDGKNLYQVGSLRNKVEKENFGNVTIGHLNLDNIHLVLMKKGNQWVCPETYFISEMNKIDYDHIARLKSKTKNFKGN